MAIAVETRKLRKIYKGLSGPRVALDGLDLRVEEGHIVGVVGPNGAGKSTIIKILAGLVRPTEGEADIFGTPCGSADSRSKLGYLPEVANYHEFMGVEELLKMHAALAGVPNSGITESCKLALGKVGLDDRRDSLMRDLSKGMKQRFGIAQALVMDAPLLILDEPTSGLDPIAQKEIKEIISDLRRQGRTIMFSSHQLTDVEMVCDVIGVLHRGKLLKMYPLDEMLAQGGRYGIIFQAGETTCEKLENEGWTVKVDDETRRLELESRQLDKGLQILITTGGKILSVMPLKLSLEDAFFSLIKGADES